MKAVDSPEESTSLQSFDGSALYDDQNCDAFDSRGGEGSCTEDVVELAMKGQSGHNSKPHWQFIDGVRAIELVGSKCYRTSHGFQKEATFPCQTVADISSTNYEGNDILEKMSPHSQPQISPVSHKRGPLERFTLMIGENVLHFKIVKAPAEQECIDEPRSATGAGKCSLCGKMLPNRSAWETHVAEVHHSSMRYHCDTCNAHFSSKIGLMSHMRCHPVPRPYKCTICTKLFSCLSSLEKHMHMHVAGHHHFCQICGRWFKSLNSLDEHENTCLATINGELFNSTQLRPVRWKCSYCSKMFYHRRDKIIHERVHTGEKPYTCGYCGRGFSQSQTLTIHIRTHTGEKPYSCEVCGQEFRDSSALRKHEYVHCTLPSSEVSSLYGD